MSIATAGLADRILREELEEHPDDVAAAVDHACCTLTGHLADLVTSEGANALMRRALHRASRDFPALRAVHVDAGGDSCLAGLADVHSDDEAARARVLPQLLVALLDLLVALVGDRLTAHLVNRIWPEDDPRAELTLEESPS